ncbi:Uncharacterized membrane protein YsdA, DUF1294 family [Dethiosulfatibacter aminovorans DSM 17477]|uniref:Uncharacterized membrane protein YsdA, DUF1294 family n=1 Tax=Dethiosulfatibacter aminovorans DSM 17477 TaxID=1121476 RepID=A0A1M6HTP2_9FIRM|nr:DUF1294 domain-containing protein [Dethiosulfatibacter aminovorans]SHJ25555.1 Uncharacterized membrane protein YsdA, DUF1294 family [Dethiosulfatibacter aminovorans DSM 17477]
MKDLVIKDIIINYYWIINAAAFILSGMDKVKAKKRKWRFKENFLHLFSFLGGAFGMFVAMVLFRHKINRRFFTVMTALAFAIHGFILAFVLLKL